MSDRIEIAKSPRRTIGPALAAVVVLCTIAGGGTVAASDHGPSPDSVFDVSRSLAIEAARTRMRLFVGDHPEPAAGTPAEAVSCPLVSTDSLGTAASVLAAERGLDLRLQLDPWNGRTTSDPELRPDSAATGVIGGVPIVRCETSRPGDGQLARPSLIALSLVDGVTFGDVMRRYNLEGVLRSRPAGIGGEMVGSCLSTDDTSVCVVLWQSRSLALGLTVEGPPEAVSTATAGAMLSALVPTVIDTLAVVTQPAPVCSAAAIAAETGVALLTEPACQDGWAFGNTAPCATEPDEGCTAVDVFHVDESGWVHNGLIDITCTESLTRLGMTVVTAREIAPDSCDVDDPSLGVGSIRPDRQGVRVTALQIALVNLGYVLPVDGRYGPLTEAAVVDFQDRNGLVVDGVAGRQTQSELGI